MRSLLNLKFGNTANSLLGFLKFGNSANDLSRLLQYTTLKRFLIFLFFSSGASCFSKIQSTDKQFNYKKLTNERTPKSKPQRPPQPTKVPIEPSKEGLLIDISPDNVLTVSPQHTPRPDSRNISILDEPIDIPEGGI